MRRKLLSIILAVGLLFTAAIPMPAVAAGDTVADAGVVTATTESGATLTYGLLFPG